MTAPAARKQFPFRTLLRAHWKWSIAFAVIFASHGIVTWASITPGRPTVWVAIPEVLVGLAFLEIGVRETPGVSSLLALCLALRMFMPAIQTATKFGAVVGRVLDLVIALTLVWEAYYGWASHNR